MHRADLGGAQPAFIDHLVGVVRAETVDAVLIAGDLYDRAIPPLESVALFEDALRRATEQIRAAALVQEDPLNRVKIAVQLLFELSRPDPAARRPLFTDFAPRLLISHPTEVRGAHAPLLALLTDLLTEAAEAGRLRSGVDPRRAAALTMQTVMFVAQSAVVADDEDLPVLSADEVWDFCANGFASA